MQPPRGARPPLWFRLVLVVLMVGSLLGAWRRPMQSAGGLGHAQSRASEWTPAGYAISGGGVTVLIVFVLFFWRED